MVTFKNEGSEQIKQTHALVNENIDMNFLNNNSILAVYENFLKNKKLAFFWFWTRAQPINFKSFENLKISILKMHVG